ncbi:MAG: hypothetical protein ISR58_03390 [Anaerolineales bacterium]|nr:hypothetical protein [Anaerolineales bacterium]
MNTPGDWGDRAMVKAIYSGFGEIFWLYLAKHLAKNNGWEPVYWVGVPQAKDVVRRDFPEAIFHSVFDAIKGLPAGEYISRAIKPIDTRIITDYAASQLILLRMMDRIDALGSFGYNDRVRLLHKQMTYWQTVLDDLKPDVVVFNVIPHLIFDYMLYEYCKPRGIKTIMFESIPVRGMTIVMDDFMGPTHINKLYAKLLEGNQFDSVPLSEGMEEFLYGLQGSYFDAPEYVRRVYKEKPYEGLRSPSKSIFQKLIDVKRYRDYFEKQRRIWLSRFRPPPNYLKQRHKKLENSKMNWLQYKKFRLGSHLKMRKLIRHYHRLAGEVDFDHPYIYVALSFQPERTTSPMGSFYVDQNLMVDLLSKTVPAGWHIYVKDHPFGFSPSKFHRAQSGRSKVFYDDLASKPNVSLVPMPINSYDLIDGAQAVAAVTGTVGWEALFRGKPVLLFGYPWYRGCEGTFRIDTVESCVDAIDIIRTGYRIEHRKLRLFAHALEQTAISASVEPHLRIEAISDEEAAARLAEGIQELVTS